MNYTVLQLNGNNVRKRANKFLPCLSISEGALYLATRGSAKICSLDEMTGKFDEGFEFDALRIKMNERRKETTLFGHESISDMIQKFVFVGDDRNIIQTYVGGKTVKACSCLKQ